MRPTLALIKREFTAYFLSPIAYVVLTVFLLVTGSLFVITLKLLTSDGPRGIEYPMSLMLGEDRFWLVFLFIPPLLTMRLFAEERGSGTLEMLMTSPVRDWQLVFAKYVACYGFYLFMWMPTAVYLPVVMDLKVDWNLSAWTPYSVPFVAGLVLAALGLAMMPIGWISRGALLFIAGALIATAGGYFHYRHDANHLASFTAGIDPYPVLTSYIGILLAGAMFLALGLFVSSLVKSQMVAAIVSLAIGLPFIAGVLLFPYIDASGDTFRVVSSFTVPLHFARDFTRGVLDTRHMMLYVTATMLFLFLTVRSVESRRWR
ncbi:ABC transporter permease [Zavarzinella formosa]|uniref:ABC transporter permease n=1 Tax=Zavarzinella formosa TaxID=360055 RepID=UPI0002DE63A8|nr:ABC transporter permease [Zavarzinella formosa]